MIVIRAEHMFERVRRLLGGMPAERQAAALPWRRKGKGVEILLVTSRDTGRWILPKGWPDPEESLHLAAEREAFEEAGIQGRISNTAIGSYMLGKNASDSRPRLVEVFVFPLAVDSVAGEWPEMLQRERRWLSPAKAARRIQETALSRIIRDFRGDFAESGQ